MQDQLRIRGLGHGGRADGIAAVVAIDRILGVLDLVPDLDESNFAFKVRSPVRHPGLKSPSDSHRRGCVYDRVVQGIRGHIHELFARVDPVWANTRNMGGLSSGEGLIWAIRDPIEKTEAIKEKGRYTGEYETVIVDAGVDDKRLLVFEPEFASVLKVMVREGSTLSPLVRQAWDTGNLRTMVKNNPAVATGAHISILGHVTKDEF